MIATTPSGTRRFSTATHSADRTGPIVLPHRIRLQRDLPQPLRHRRDLLSGNASRATQRSRQPVLFRSAPHPSRSLRSTTLQVPTMHLQSYAAAFFCSPDTAANCRAAPLHPHLPEPSPPHPRRRLTGRLNHAHHNLSIQGCPSFLIPQPHPDPISIPLACHTQSSRRSSIDARAGHKSLAIFLHHATRTRMNPETGRACFSEMPLPFAMRGFRDATVRERGRAAAPFRQRSLTVASRARRPSEPAFPGVSQKTGTPPNMLALGVFVSWRLVSSAPQALCKRIVPHDSLSPKTCLFQRDSPAPRASSHSVHYPHARSRLPPSRSLLPAPTIPAAAWSPCRPRFPPALPSPSPSNSWTSSPRQTSRKLPAPPQRRRPRPRNQRPPSNSKAKPSPSSNPSNPHSTTSATSSAPLKPPAAKITQMPPPSLAKGFLPGDAVVTPIPGSRRPPPRQPRIPTSRSQPAADQQFDAARCHPQGAGASIAASILAIEGGLLHAPRCPRPAPLNAGPPSSTLFPRPCSPNTRPHPRLLSLRRPCWPARRRCPSLPERRGEPAESPAAAPRRNPPRLDARRDLLTGLDAAVAGRLLHTHRRHLGLIAAAWPAAMPLIAVKFLAECRPLGARPGLEAAVEAMGCSAEKTPPSPRRRPHAPPRRMSKLDHAGARVPAREGGTPQPPHAPAPRPAATAASSPPPSSSSWAVRLPWLAALGAMGVLRRRLRRLHSPASASTLSSPAAGAILRAQLPSLAPWPHLHRPASRAGPASPAKNSIIMLPPSKPRSKACLTLNACLLRIRQPPCTSNLHPPPRRLHPLLAALRNLAHSRLRPSSDFVAPSSVRLGTNIKNPHPPCPASSNTPDTALEPPRLTRRRRPLRLPLVGHHRSPPQRPLTARNARRRNQRRLHHLRLAKDAHLSSWPSPTSATANTLPNGHCGPSNLPSSALTTDHWPLTTSADNDATTQRPRPTSAPSTPAAALTSSPLRRHGPHGRSIRSALDAGGFPDTAISSLRRLHASAFYGPSATPPNPRPRPAPASATAKPTRWTRAAAPRKPSTKPPST